MEELVLPQKYSETGKRRTLYNSEYSNFAIITGSRISRHWEDALKDMHLAEHQIGRIPTAQEIDKFYRGWIEPLSRMNDDYCGCKASLMAKSHSVMFINVKDLMEFSLTTDYLPMMFTGCTTDSFIPNNFDYNVECFKHDGLKSFAVQRSSVSPYSIAMNLLKRGDINKFTLSLTGWGGIEKMAEWYEDTSAQQRLARLISLESDDTYTPRLRFTTPRTITNILKENIESVTGSEKEALFFILLILANGGSFDTDYIPTQEEVELLRDDDFCRRLISLISKIKPKRGDSQIPNFHLLIRAAENDIDTSIIMSMMMD